MKSRLANLLVCPLDRTPLRLVAWESSGDEITTGVLAKFAKLVQGAEKGAVTNVRL